MEYLIKYRVNIYNNSCENRNISIIKYVIKHREDINKKDWYNKRTPLFFSCRNGHVNLVKCLIKHIAYININNVSKETPLDMVYESGNKKFSKVFSVIFKDEINGK
ncbi:hypothetical protein BCR32DRAFT_245680 [Anaeromyces robustus]|uniref:Uncharacterized protein n=1 Tax=Anaeromyces robustus TaxID=1754192 RepID=A0A1Y1X3I1_9FUNG|nr:hypothetical protein BCR32DRAFT_245680 [Anaeromyces robustus]|eukprot:ORX80367.1 hypothetical protein BCR32DRAFT_245680 [Anaeromyces robustus]